MGLVGRRGPFLEGFIFIYLMYMFMWAMGALRRGLRVVVVVRESAR